MSLVAALSALGVHLRVSVILLIGGAGSQGAGSTLFKSKLLIQSFDLMVGGRSRGAFSGILLPWTESCLFGDLSTVFGDPLEGRRRKLEIN